MTERDEQALRAALQALGTDEPVDAGAARRRAAELRRNRRTAAGVLVALVLVVGVVGLPRVLPMSGAGSTSAPASGAEAGGGGGQADARGADPQTGGEPGVATPAAAPTEQVPTDSAPDGWRTEYYRDIAFAVPAGWGYAIPPGSDWCANDPKGRLSAEQRRPYVWLASDLPVRAIGCPEPRPASLLSEHVVAESPGPATDYVEGAVRQGEWWVVTRFAGSAVLTVTTKDRARAERILDSAQVGPAGAPCPPSSPVTGPAGTRPDDVSDLAKLSPVEAVALCQYEPVEDAADANLPRLRAARQLRGTSAQALVDRLTEAPVNESACPAADTSEPPDLALLVRVFLDGRAYDVFVNAAGCSAGAGMTGGIDDGTTVRLLTRDTCRPLLTSPLAIFSAGGDVARSCLS